MEKARNSHLSPTVYGADGTLLLKVCASVGLLIPHLVWANSASNTQTFELFLQHVPLIQSATYVIHNPGEAAKETIELRFDGTNYLAHVIYGAGPDLKKYDSVYGGSFHGVPWRLADRGLMFCDPVGDPGDIAQTGDPLRRITVVNRLLNLGVQEMVPGTVEMDSSHKGFTADYQRLIGPKGRLTVTLDDANGVPRSAVVADDQRTAYITYKYSPDFHGGKLPIEIERFTGPEKDAASRVFTLTLIDLQLADTNVPLANLDPIEALKGAYDFQGSWSHGAPYRLNAGKLQKIMDAAELDVLEASVREKERPRSTGSSRAMLLLLACVPLIWWALVRKRKRVSATPCAKSNCYPGG